MKTIVDDFQVRKAVPQDIEPILKIEEELAGRNPMLETKILKMLEDDSSYFLVATVKDEVIGYVGGVIRDVEFGEKDPIGYLTHVGLKKEYMNKGMGKIMGDRLINAMLPKCSTFRTLLSFERNDLQSFFNHLGFKRTDILVYELKEN
ncbi:MAG: GNAT family N-acetyltransferase [Methanobacteriota archaeon]|nr:MAG: GNAT family N-acetyltransferase [Euryarchaeota archaeon]